MYKMNKSSLKLICLILFIILTLLGCANFKSTSESRGSWADGFGYQYLSPKVYCHTVDTDVGFELYCPEGRIEVGFELPLEKVTLEGFLTIKLANDIDEYRIDKLDSFIADATGKPLPIIMATLINSSDYYLKPTHVAVLEVGNRYSYLYGFAYRDDFISDLTVYFQKVAFSLEPFEP